MDDHLRFQLKLLTPTKDIEKILRWLDATTKSVEHDLKKNPTGMHEKLRVLNAMHNAESDLRAIIKFSKPKE